MPARPTGSPGLLSAATNVGFATTIRDARTDSVKAYTNPDLTAA